MLAQKEYKRGHLICWLWLIICLFPGFLPSYLLPAYDEVIDRPATPPPPYTPVLATPPPTDTLAESCDHAATPIPSDAVCTAIPETLQLQSQITHTNKDSMQGRYRRFTGDSGIEVFDGQELWDQPEFLPRGQADDDEVGQMQEACVCCGSPGCEHSHRNNGPGNENTDGHNSWYRPPVS